MNYRIIFKMLSYILMSIGFAFFTSLIIAFIYKKGFDRAAVLQHWTECITLVGILTILFAFLGRNASMKISRKEALCVIGTGWLLSTFIGALPYIFILKLNWEDAIFESASAFTTTGATIFTDLEILPRSILFWRAINQWIGGLGVIVFFVAILSFSGSSAKVLYSHESSAHSTDVNTARIEDGVFRILILYLILSLSCMIALYSCGMNAFDALCHTFTTLSTGGFSNYNTSIAYFNNPLIEGIIALFMILGGTSFLVISQMVTQRWKMVQANTEFLTYLGILFSMSCIIAFILWETGSMSVLNALRYSTFQVISIMTTTGFASTDYQLWAPVCHTLIMTIMIIGGSSGSTSGGVKVSRFVITLKVCLLHIERTFRTRLIRTININGRKLDEQAREGVLTFMAMFGLTALLSITLIAAIENELSFEGNISLFLASFCNIGPGFNEVGPSANCAFLQASTKYFLSFLMILGRLEFYAILALFSPALWRRFD